MTSSSHAGNPRFGFKYVGRETISDLQITQWFLSMIFIRLLVPIPLTLIIQGKFPGQMDEF